MKKSWGILEKFLEKLLEELLEGHSQRIHTRGIMDKFLEKLRKEYSKEFDEKLLNALLE